MRARNPVTDYELQVITLMARGATEKQAAARLGRSVPSVKHALRMARLRLDATTTTHLVACAIGLRLLPANVATRGGDDR